MKRAFDNTVEPKPIGEYKPRLRTQVTVLGTFFLVVLPAIYFAGMGYIWFLEHGLKLDMNARPEGIMDRLVVLMMVLPIIPVMLAAIMATGIPWMFVMARCLSWPDIQYFTSQKGPRFPMLSDWIDRMWSRMTEFKRPKSPTNGLSR
ncbi:MAG: hypothetical protein WCO56_08245 [Verrucomicrobiota bacterium]